MAEEFTKYEIARIFGARGLQIAMDAPLLVKIEKEQLEKIRYDPIEIAKIEFESGVLPITVRRPMPKKIERKLKREEVKKIEEKKPEDKEEKAAKEIGEETEIVELATPEDEKETEEKPEEEGV